MKTFKQFVNESLLDMFTRPLNTRPHLGAFGTHSDSNVDITNPEYAHLDPAYHLEYDSIQPRSYVSKLGVGIHDVSEHHGNRHLQSILQSTELPFRTKNKFGKHTTYVPMDGDHVDVRAAHTGYGSLEDYIRYHLHPKAEAHMDAMASGPGHESRRLTKSNVMVLHSDDIEQHPDAPHMNVVRVASRGWHPRVHTFKYSPVTRHSSHVGAFDIHPDAVPEYPHDVTMHSVNVLTNQERRHYKQPARHLETA